MSDDTMAPPTPQQAPADGDLRDRRSVLRCAALVDASTPDKVGDPGTGSPNKLLFVGKVDPARR